MHQIGLLWYFGDPLGVFRPQPRRHRNDPDGGLPLPDAWRGDRDEEPRRRRCR
jgi:hypothetical protein